MRKFWAIAWHEYTRHVFRKRFIFVLLSVPLWLLFALGMGLLSVFLTLDTRPVGLVDPGHAIVEERLPDRFIRGPARIPFLRFEDEAAGRAALEAGRLQILYILPPDYPATTSARMVYKDEPDGFGAAQIANLLRYNLLAEVDPAVRERVMLGPALEVQATEEDRSIGGDNWLRVVAPIAAGALLLGSLFTTSGYLVQAVVEEKENRTMEILATSASAGAIMNAKVAALILVGMTQLLAWVGPPVLVIALAGPALPVALPPLDLGPLLLALATALPTLLLVAALMAAVGATLTEAREGQQVMTLFSFLVTLPFLLIPVIALRPEGIFARALTYFPLTASLTLLLRMAFSVVPPWEVALATGVILASSAGAMWLARWLFRQGMLRYGKRIRLREILSGGLRQRPRRTPRGPEDNRA